MRTPIGLGDLAQAVSRLEATADAASQIARMLDVAVKPHQPRIPAAPEPAAARDPGAHPETPETRPDAAAGENAAPTPSIAGETRAILDTTVLDRRPAEAAPWLN